MNEKKTKLKSIVARCIFALLATYVLCTLCWIVWGIMTPGDFFANGSSLVIPSLIATGIIGAIVGATIKGNVTRLTVFILVFAATLFWIFAPDGWWATPSPMPTDSQVNI